MKKYIIFFNKKNDGVYRPMLGSNWYLQVDARRTYLSDREAIRKQEIEKETFSIWKLVCAKNLSDALELSKNISFTI